MFRKLLLNTVFAVLFLTLVGIGSAAASGKEEGNAPEFSSGAAPVMDENRKTTSNSDGKYDKIVIAVNADPEDLLPCNPNVGSKPVIYHEIYECLFDLDNGEYIPVLAKGYEKTDDLHYLVEIYDNIYDSAGNHITADDILYCYDYLVNSGYALKYQIFGGIKKVDDYRVEFTWTQPVTALAALEFPWCRTYIFSRKAFEAQNFATAPIATGPYTVKSFVSGSKVVLEANGNYWQKDKSLRLRTHEANVQTIEYDIISEMSQHYIAFGTGAIDYSESVPFENMNDFAEGGRYADQYGALLSPGSFYYLADANCNSDSLCSDVNLRMALYYAIDNESCATAVGNSIACSAYGTGFFGDYVDAWDGKESYYTAYDPEKAKEYLKKSSYKGEELVLLGGNNESAKKLMVVMQSFLLQVGIKAKIKSVETNLLGSYYSSTDGWDMLIAECSGPNLIGSWNLTMNNKEFSHGMTLNYIKDDKLQSLFELCNSAAGHTDENMTALLDYTIEKGYYYSLITTRKNTVYNRDMAELFYREDSFILPGACVYYLK